MHRFNTLETIVRPEPEAQRFPGGETSRMEYHCYPGDGAAGSWRIEHNHGPKYNRKLREKNKFKELWPTSSSPWDIPYD